MCRQILDDTILLSLKTRSEVLSEKNPANGCPGTRTESYRIVSCKWLYPRLINAVVWLFVIQREWKKFQLVIVSKGILHNESMIVFILLSAATTTAYNGIVTDTMDQ